MTGKYSPAQSRALRAHVASVRAIERFGRAKTNPEPWKPATALVTEGIYARTRNPMYLGMAIAYAGLAILWDCWFTLALLLLALLVIPAIYALWKSRGLNSKNEN